MINFVILEDVRGEFEKYSGMIRAIFEDLGFTGNQILDNHSSVLKLMRLYWDYIRNKDKSLIKKSILEHFIKDNELKTSTIIYIIDDNWKNAGDNHDGTDFFKDFLHMIDEKGISNSCNAIVLTNYNANTKYLQLPYVCKLRIDIRELLKIQISSTMVFRQATMNNDADDRERVNSLPETGGIPGDQARLISNT
jgi:hypothetical protein